MLVALALLVVGGAPVSVELRVPASVDLACEARRCRAVIPLEVKNTGSEPARLNAVNGRAELALQSVEPDGGVIAPGATWSGQFMVSRGGTWELTLDVTVGPLTAKNASLRKVQVIDRARDKAMADCRACRGDWGPHGMLGIEGCLCRAKDAGKVCRDGRECEGECLAERVEVVRPAQPLRCDAGRCTASVALGRRVGRCSELIGDFGCVSPIEAGALDKGPQPLPLPFQQICRD